jgi:hypothetical protein
MVGSARINLPFSDFSSEQTPETDKNISVSDRTKA